MTARERVERVGVCLRSMLHHTLSTKADQEMRRAIDELHKVATAEIKVNQAGRDRALDLLAKDR